MSLNVLPIATKAPDTAAFNHWVASALADPKRAHLLKSDWRKLAETELALSSMQKQHLAGIPAKDAEELQAAIAKVVDHGGSIHIERESETSAGLLVVKPKADANKPGAASPDFSVVIFHCTFDANCRNWHCGWGPGKRT